MGLSRKAIMSEIDDSLRRLGTDYIDLYQIHRWDPNTPIEETMEALHDLVKVGKVRYIGASSMSVWQFAKAQHVAERNGWTRFISMEIRLNLLYREEEREMLPFCKDDGVAVTPYLPFAAGRLTRDWNEQIPRSENDQVAKALFTKTEKADRKVAERVAEVAANRDFLRAQVALAWLLQKVEVTAPIIGATKVSHLEDAVSALSVKLTSEEIKSLEELYVPHWCKYTTAFRVNI
ncbi:aryl-alcohol dehydrogenase-like predicted oxidoreductase [Gracilibacillus alcaliphilus]|nr:aryl-alcohol dehydrogenase-like predicted oxidoreductase [Gracilibacillus alcaliphilus]